MAEFHENPSLLTKDRLKSELAANNVPLPSGDHKKEVYVQLYKKNLTAQNNKKSPPADTFSSDEELPTPVVSNKSRSGKKATKKTDKPRLEDVEVTELTDEDLKQQLAKYGVNPGPILATTRKVYEDKLQKLRDEVADEAEAPDVTTLPKADSSQNGNTNSDQYSDKEDEEPAPPEPEQVPVVEKPVRSRGKATPVTGRTSSRRQTKQVVEEILTEETPKKTSKNVIEDILANEISTPTGISATCRRPIKGAAGRPLKPSEYWLDESRVKRSISTETRTYSETISRPSASVPTSKAPVRRGFLPLLLKLLLLAVVVGSLYYVYQNLDSDQVRTLRGLLDSVIVPVQSAVETAGTYLGIGGSGATESTGK
ncbi:Lamina-associated polypeptide 2, isoforms beta/delta/epsilon/gamma [Oryzias melastigma]|uniref:Lamina-associated polypeptide 2, isoforms beta/delta/epsilon/gamma n=1 Tax=Oryzias melastigma TaxID=30732 RepID=A0A834EYU8_ORYME|nr:Lamina-associated polypeptide 2, isoforms beta/delta/epsilon/gamma [Oryzias melastigma]